MPRTLRIEAEWTPRSRGWGWSIGVCDVPAWQHKAVSTADLISIIVHTGINLRHRLSACVAITKSCPALGILGQPIHISYDATDSDDEEEDIQGAQKDGLG